MKNKKFSNSNRASMVEKIKVQKFDVIVIGGGITGAGILLDAASRGLKAILLEKNDFASGTSSKSTKLIHGGLRYLKQFDFGLVQEVGTERAIVHKLAPHLVIPEKMLLPIIKDGSYSKWLTSIGLKIYDILAGVSGDDKRKMLGKKETISLEPLVPEEIVEGAGYYAEYRTDDARLTIENLKTAITFGATALNYSKVTNMVYENGKIVGVAVEDETTNEPFEIKSDYVISAAGPWVDTLRKKDNSLQGKRLHLSKGVHIVFPREKFPIQQSIYFDVPDGRMMFAIPRGKVTYLGTSDTDYNQNIDEVYADIEDVNYLLNGANNMFPDLQLTKEDVLSSWAGLRPLIHEEGKSASELSRKDEIFVSETGFISIAGGKLTGYRKMAERIVDKVIQKMDNGSKYKDCTTDKIKLSGNGFTDFKEVKKYISYLYEKIQKDGFTNYDAKYLAYNYGKQTDSILENYAKSSVVDPREKMILAELKYTTEFEMVLNPLDFFIRRTGRLYFDILSIEKHLEAVLLYFKNHLGASDIALKNWKNDLQKEIKKHSSFS